MPPKKNTKTGTDLFIVLQEVENSATRSRFGDHHAATEDTMLAAHARHMLENGHIDSIMAAELSKPRHNVDEFRVKYTAEYLAQHPSYTGQNYHNMPSLEVAMRRQKNKDDAQLEFLQDFVAGKIDANGNRIMKIASQASSQGIHGGFHCDDAGPLKDKSDTFPAFTDDESGVNMNVTTKDSSSAEPKLDTSKGSALPGQSSPMKNAAIKTQKPATLTPYVLKQPSSVTKTTLVSSSSSPAKSKAKIIPLIPLADKSTYTTFTYYELTAICRQRGLPSRGREQQVRNTLIQDDINVSEGRVRHVTKSQGKEKRKYKHKAPDVVVSEWKEEVTRDRSMVRKRSTTAGMKSGKKRKAKSDEDKEESEGESASEPLQNARRSRRMKSFS